MIVRQNCLISIFTIFIFTLSYSQVKPKITARVDTTNNQKREIYNLYTNYINSYPDSTYINPFWNKKEAIENVQTGMNCNRSAWFMFRGFDSAKSFYKVYPPTILSIVKINRKRYSIRILFDNESDGYEKFTPPYINKLYAVKDKDASFKLENSIKYDTDDWKTYDFNFIHYIVSPDCKLDSSEAKDAIQFCDSVTHLFKIKAPQQITYYLTNNSDKLGQLFNFDYWLSYSTGITNTPTNEVYTSFGNANYRHELVHMLLKPLYENIGGTMIVSEGITTWLAGPEIGVSFEDALFNFSNKIKDVDSVTIDNIVNNEFRNQYDNNPIYVTGGVICQKAFQKKGIKAVIKLFNTPKNEFKKSLEEIFEKPYSDINDEVIDYIKTFWNR